MSGIITDIVNTIKDIKKTISAHTSSQVVSFDDASNGMLSRLASPVESAARRAKKSIIVFPMIVSDVLETKIVNILANAHQMQCAEYVRVMMTNDGVASMGDADASTVKQNIISRLRGGALFDETAKQDAINKYISQNMQSMLFESCQPLYENSATAKRKRILQNQGKLSGIGATNTRSTPSVPSNLKFSTLKGDRDLATLEKYFNDVLSAINVSSSSSTLVPTDIMYKHLVEIGKDIGFAAGDISSLSSKDLISPAVLANFVNQKLLERDYKANKKEKEKASRALNKFNSKEKSADYIPIKATSSITVSGNTATNKDNPRQPAILDLKVQLVAADNSSAIVSNLMLGISSNVHRIPTSDMVMNICNSVGSDSLVFNFLRVTSGEISFLSDFLFSFKQIKDSIVHKTKASSIFSTLKRQVSWNHRSANAIYREVTNAVAVPPTATIVLSLDEVKQIRSITNMDLTKAGAARDFMNKFNLMGLMIVDSAINAVNIFEDGDGDFSLMSLDELSRKNSSNVISDMLTVMARR